MAIGVAKMAFGGIGKNIFNPALVGRVFLFISFPVQMTTWVKPHVLDFFNVDATTSATPLNVLKHITENDIFSPEYMNLFLGNIGGSMGETSALFCPFCGSKQDITNEPVLNNQQLRDNNNGNNSFNIAQRDGIQ